MGRSEGSATRLDGTTSRSGTGRRVSLTVAGLLCIALLAGVVIANADSSGRGEGIKATDASAKKKGKKGKKKRAADTVLRNAFVYTVDEDASVKRALAVRNGKLVYVGGKKGVRRYIGKRTEVLKMGGRMVMPGLHEGHIHDITKPARPTCDLEGVPLTVPEFQARIQSCLDDPELHTAEPGAPDDFLIVSNFYMQFLRPPGTSPHKSMLDALDTDRPIFAPGIFGHTFLVNQNALDLAGITRDTPDPPGGRINHDPDGEPNGLLEDAAAGLVTELIPPPPPLTPQQRVELAAERMQDFSKEGITSFFVPGIPADEQTLATFNTLQNQGRLTARAHFALLAVFEDIANPTEALFDDYKRIRSQYEEKNEIPLSVRSWRPGTQTGPRLVAEPGVSIDGVKMFVDGILQFPGQTAAVTEPYLENIGTVEDPVYVPRTDENAFGELFFEGDELAPMIIELERRGFQSHIHAIGDAAVRAVLDGFEAAQEANGDLQLRAHETIAHAELVHPDDYDRFGELGVTASMGLQWAKPAPDSTEAVKPYMSGNRWDLYEPTVPITEGGGRVSLGSDCCVDPFDEWFALEVGILREADWGPEFPEFEGKLNALPGLSVEEGIRAATIHGAYQMQQQKVSGSLEKGKLADLVVLNQNIARVDPEQIGDTDPLLTMVGGRKVWVDPAFEDEWGTASTWPAE
jgi:predicted amidohydrolase YtcJ